jgi:pimeloyl-ACP methyl ester carboxylesterase
MSFINLDGATIAYSLEGPEDAPVLLFCNSLGTTMSMWEEQAAFFKSQYRVLRYDVPGHGDSSSPEPFY